ncbi:MAG: hypothetical protein AAFY34_15810 [Pseudomonadota bacterium]
MDEKLDDVMRRLSQDPKYQEMKRQQEEKRQFFKKLLEKDEKDLVTELRANGRFVDSVWDLVNSENDYDDCLPILASHLKKPHHPRVTEGGVRALSIPSAIGTSDLRFNFAMPKISFVSVGSSYFSSRLR